MTPPALNHQQLQAAAFLADNPKTILLAPVGAGKTATTIEALRLTFARSNLRRVLVVAPKRTAQHTWPTELQKWWPTLRYEMATGAPKARDQALHRPDAQTKVVITNVENVQTIQHLDQFDGLIIDELTKFKQTNGKRYRHLRQLSAELSVRWGLTGSFTTNGLKDVFGQCDIIDRAILGLNKTAFLNRFFIPINPKFEQWVPRSTALEEIMALIRPRVYTMDATEYHNNLPPLYINTYGIPFTDPKPYQKLIRDFRTNFGGTTVSAATAGVLAGKLQQMAIGAAYPDEAHDAHTRAEPNAPPGPRAAAWHDTGKLDLVEDIIAENQGAPTIIVYWYRFELEALKKRFPDAQTIHDRDVVERWNRGEIPVLLLHSASAGHGLNLQYGGRFMIWTTLPWSAELWEQTVGRLHRGGQKHPVYVYVILRTGTVEARIREALNTRQSVSSLALEALLSTEGE